jgi:hypothetical protein
MSAQYRHKTEAAFPPCESVSVGGIFPYCLSCLNSGSNKIFSREDRPARRKESLDEAIMELRVQISATIPNDRETIVGVSSL